MEINFEKWHRWEKHSENNHSIEQACQYCGEVAAEGVARVKGGGYSALGAN